MGQKKSITGVLVTLMIVLTASAVWSAGTDSVAVELSRIGISNPSSDEAGQVNDNGLTAETARQLVELDREKSRQLVLSQFCDQQPRQDLCADLPNDNTDFSALFVYIFLSAAAQNSFDIFSWQSFIALNWPITEDAEPLHELPQSNNYRPNWSTFVTPQKIYAPDNNSNTCNDTDPKNSFSLTTSNYLQPTGQPLIDQNLNYVVYDVRVNQTMVNYITDNQLDSVDGQRRFKQSGHVFDFPVGYYDDPVTKTGGEPGSIAIKTAWKIVDKNDGKTPGRYFTVNGQIEIPADQSDTGQALCIKAKLGLVGMHIMRRVDSGNGRQWIWSTFEHINNAPLALNSRRPNDILHVSPFTDGCLAPETNGQHYAFFNPQCTDCVTNTLSPSHWTWSASSPYSGKYALEGGKATQVVQCWDIFDGTKLVNNEWQKKLDGTVWANYRSVSAQWKGANRGKMVPEGEVPRYMTNTTLETYEQHKLTGSCMSCHASARSAAGQATGFSFLPSLISRYQ